jgi:hypothetical protein
MRHMSHVKPVVARPTDPLRSCDFRSNHHLSSGFKVVVERPNDLPLSLLVANSHGNIFISRTLEIIGIKQQLKRFVCQ